MSSASLTTASTLASRSTHADASPPQSPLARSPTSTLTTSPNTAAGQASKRKPVKSTLKKRNSPDRIAAGEGGHLHRHTQRPDRAGTPAARSAGSPDGDVERGEADERATSDGVASPPCPESLRDAKRKKKGKAFVWLVAFAASLGGSLFGYEIGIIDQILIMQSFNIQFGLSIEQYNATTNITNINPSSRADFLKGLITSSFLFGCVVGAAIVSILADKLGRKLSILIGGFIFTLGGAGQTFSSVISVLIAFRILSGVAIGILSMSVPLYISEASPPQIRGRLTTIYQLMITFGIFIASCVNGIILSAFANNIQSNDVWRIALGMQMLPGTILFSVMLPMPRSPRWLAEKGYHDEGLRTVAKLRGEPESARSVEVEYGQIRAGIEFERQIGTASWSELLRPGVRRRLLIGVVNQFWQQWTGINVILYYAATLFHSMGFSDDPKVTGVTFVIINAFINMIATIPGMWGVERFGRRPLLIWGGIAMMACHLVVFTFGTVSSPENFNVRPVAWLAVFGSLLFTMAFACTWGPVVWTYQSEIFPLRIRAKGTGLSTMSNWLWNAVIALISPSIFSAIGWYTYLYLVDSNFLKIFAACCFSMTLWTMHFIPETRGRTLEEMDDVFGDNMAVISTGEWDWRYEFRERRRGSMSSAAEKEKRRRRGRSDGPSATGVVEMEERSRRAPASAMRGSRRRKSVTPAPVDRARRRESGTPAPGSRRTSREEEEVEEDEVVDDLEGEEEDYEEGEEEVEYEGEEGEAEEYAEEGEEDGGGFEEDGSPVYGAEVYDEHQAEVDAGELQAEDPPRRRR
ncbi:hypothetical protein HK101_003643 [Irineochytrium annulatum]|nr:hypothetical protein HK101_003643 [Irineochytrium annulatum]